MTGAAAVRDGSPSSSRGYSHSVKTPSTEPSNRPAASSNHNRARNGSISSSQFPTEGQIGGRRMFVRKENYESHSPSLLHRDQFSTRSPRPPYSARLPGSKESGSDSDSRLR